MYEGGGNVNGVNFVIVHGVVRVCTVVFLLLVTHDFSKGFLFTYRTQHFLLQIGNDALHLQGGKQGKDHRNDFSY